MAPVILIKLIVLFQVMLISKVYSSCEPHRVRSIQSIEHAEITNADTVCGGNPGDYPSNLSELCVEANAWMYAYGQTIIPEIELPRFADGVNAGEVGYFAASPLRGGRRLVLWGVWCTGVEPPFILTLQNPTVRRLNLKMDAYFESGAIQQQGAQIDEPGTPEVTGE